MSLIAFDRYAELCESINGYNLVVRASRIDARSNSQILCSLSSHQLRHEACMHTLRQVIQKQ